MNLRILALLLVMGTGFTVGHDLWAGGGNGKKSTTAPTRKKVAGSKRKGLQEQIEEQESSRKKESPDSPVAHDLQVFLQSLDSTNQDLTKSYAERFDKFTKNLSTYKERDKPKSWHAQLHVSPPVTSSSESPPKILSLEVKEGDFGSEITTEQEFNRLAGLSGDRKYYWITLREPQQGLAPGDFPILLKIRLDSDGILGELLTLKKGSFLSGTDVLKLSNTIRDYLKPKAFFLFDDAQVAVPSSVELPKGESHTIVMKKYYPFVSQTCSTWYAEQGGYLPFNFKLIKSLRPDVRLSHQNEEVYQAASLKLRSLLLSDLIKSIFVGKFMTPKKKLLTKLIETYFAAELRSSNLPLVRMLEDEKFTLTELVRRIQSSLKQNKNNSYGRTNDEAWLDFHQLTNEILHIEKDVWDDRPGSPLRNFVLAARVLGWHCIWVKQDTSNPVNWSESTQLKRNISRPLTTQSFDQMVGQLDRNIEDWEKAAPQILMDTQ